MAIQKITDENFEEKVMKSSKPFLIRFTAEWCGPCKALAPIVEKISDEMTEIEFGVLDIDSEPNSPIRPEFSVRGVPSCFIVKSGSVVGSKVGLTNRQDFISWIKESIA